MLSDPFSKEPDAFTVKNCLSNKQRYRRNRLVQSPICGSDIVTEDELQDLVAGRTPSYDDDSSRQSGWRERICRFFEDLSFNGKNS